MAKRASPQPRARWLDCFLDFIGNLKITSKELESTTPRPLLDVVYRAQMIMLNEIAAGLDAGQHDFKFLKSRQLGASTMSLAVDVFWLSVHDGIQGALITDTDGNREKFRIILEQYIESLPKQLRVGIKKHNRNNLVFQNGSVLDYLVAGVKKGNDALGVSRALNFVHATEVSRWASEDGLDSLIATLAQKHPNRLYIWESTARGFNLWYNMWEKAKKDPEQRAVFLGWWTKEDYALDPKGEQFRQFWDGELEDEETEMVNEVKRLYGYRITPSQIAWHRYMRTMKIHGEAMMAQEYPSTESEAFIATGLSFFSLRRVTEDIKVIHESKVPLRAFRYLMGENFLATELEQLPSTDGATLRIWEEPKPGAIYTMGIDPAFGRNDNKDRHSIQVTRCFADKLVQVAEYATDDHDTYQLTWVMAHLAGAYKNVWLNLEINGPGQAIMLELKHLKQQLDQGYLRAQATSMDLLDVFSSVRWYLYHRPDTMGAGYLYNFKTGIENKMKIMNQMRDSYALRMLVVRSIPLLEEMRYVRQEGSTIEAEGHKHDDRVFAMALATTAWIDWIRSNMIATHQTYDKVIEEERSRSDSPEVNTVMRAVQGFFQSQHQARVDAEEAAAWAGIDQ